MKTVLMVTVGNTADPILQALQQTSAEAGEVTVYLIYGRPFPDQKPSPLTWRTKPAKGGTPGHPRAPSRGSQARGSGGVPESSAGCPA